MDLGAFVARLYPFLTDTERSGLVYDDVLELEFNNQGEIIFPNVVAGLSTKEFAKFTKGKGVPDNSLVIFTQGI